MVTVRNLQFICVCSNLYYHNYCNGFGIERSATFSWYKVVQKQLSQRIILLEMYKTLDMPDVDTGNQLITSVLRCNVCARPFRKFLFHCRRMQISSVTNDVIPFALFLNTRKKTVTPQTVFFPN